MKKVPAKRRPLTPYGRWVINRINETGSSVNELAAQIGIFPQNLSRMLRGHTSGISYRSRIERILGRPPEDIQKSA